LRILSREKNRDREEKEREIESEERYRMRDQKYFQTKTYLQFKFVIAWV